jgi:Domain of unknown function DUF11/Fibronectin type III domain
LRGPPGTGKAPPAGAQALEPAIAGPLAPIPSPTQNFAGLSHDDLCGGVGCGGGWPPDPNGDVGPNHYIQAVNTAYAIYSKAGSLLASFTEDQLWSGIGTSPCNGNSQGDPIALYDALADRWILTHFAFAFSGDTPVAPFYQCIAVSQTSDPVAGGWYFYALQMDPGGAGRPPAGTLNDYAKFGVWNDCVYMAANGFSGNTFVGSLFASFSRTDLYSGAPLTWSLGILSSSGPFTMIPSNLSGKAGLSLPANTPNYFVSESTTLFAFEVRKFTPGANCGAGGTLSAATNVSQASYGIPGAPNVSQPNTSNKLDGLSDRLMQRVQYRKVGAAESLWVVHNVRGSTPVSTMRPQWAELGVTGQIVATTPVQQQIYAPDTTLHRWMGSLAVDAQGNMALGYSTSNGTAPNFPSIAYSGRLAGDPLNTLPQTETQLIAGLGSQTNTCGGAPCDRWGDYTAMSVDPADDCTFWYTNEYYSSQTNGNNGNWQTRIGSFKFPSCGPPQDLAIVKSHTGNFAQGQSGAIYTISVSNAGANPSSGTVSVTDALPSGLTATALSGTGWTCVLGTLTCTRSDSLSSGASFPAITLTVGVAGNAPANVTNTATLSIAGDTNSANNIANDDTTIVGVPAAPTAVTATAGNTLATVSFTPPASNGGSAITGYVVTSIPGGGVDVNAGSIATTHTVTGLTNGVSYTFTVKAVNAIGAGPSSSPSNSVTPFAPTGPLVPSNIVYVAPTGGDHTSIQAAINAASATASPINPILIRIAPGVYFGQITLKDYVDVEGSGPNVTQIAYGGVGGTVITGAQSEMRNLSVVNLNNASNPGANAIFQTGNTAGGSTKLSNVTLVADGPTDNLAVYVGGGTLLISGSDVRAAPSGTQTTLEVGIFATGATASVIFKNGSLSANAGSPQNAARQVAGGKIAIENAQLTGTTFGTPLCFRTFDSSYSAVACP